MAADFGSFTFGYSSKGAGQYLEDIKAIAIDEASKKLESYDAVEQALKAGWEGQAPDDFMKKFKDAVRDAKSSLKDLSKDLDKQFDDIGDSVTKHDKSVVDTVFGDGQAK